MSFVLSFSIVDNRATDISMVSHKKIAGRPSGVVSLPVVQEKKLVWLEWATPDKSPAVESTRSSEHHESFHSPLFDLKSQM